MNAIEKREPGQLWITNEGQEGNVGWAVYRVEDDRRMSFVTNNHGHKNKRNFRLDPDDPKWEYINHLWGLLT